MADYYRVYRVLRQTLPTDRERDWLEREYMRWQEEDFLRTERVF